MKKVILACLLVGLQLPLFAQSWLWGVQGWSSSDAYGTAVDTKGNVYLTGPFIDSITFGNQHLNSIGSNCYLVKYDSLGKLVWAGIPSRVASNVSTVYSSVVALDKFGNEYITGGFTDTVYFGTDTLRNTSGINTMSEYPSGSSVFLTKYNKNGNIVWAKQGIVPSQESNGGGSSIVTDNLGNIYLAGIFGDTISFGPFILKSPSYDFFLVKYDTNGNVKWAKQSHSSSSASEVRNAVITIDKFADIYMAIVPGDTISIGSQTLYGKNGPYLLVKYDSAGNVLFTKQTLSYANSISTDDFGNFYITGVVYDTVVFGHDTLRTNGWGEMFLAKYDSKGNAIWAKQSLTTDNGYWTGYAVSVDNAGYVYCSGGSRIGGNGKIKFGGKNFLYDSTASDPSLIVKLDSMGNVICGSAIMTGGDDNNEIVVDPSGKYVYLGGDIEINIVFGQDTLFNKENISEDPFIARWQACNNTTDGVSKLQPNNNSIAVFPNPFTTTTSIVFNTNGKHYVELDDITGRKLESIEYTGKQYELSRNGLAAGIYFIRAFDEGMKYMSTAKIVVE